MDNQSKRIRDFKKYIPFIDYRLNHKIKFQGKIEKIKEWIDNQNTSLQDHVLDNIEEALASQYRKAIIAGYEVPKEFACLFKKNEKLEGEVDLCADSDDDDDVLIVEENLVLSSDERNIVNKQNKNKNTVNELSPLIKSVKKQGDKNTVNAADTSNTVICLDSESEDEDFHVAKKQTKDEEVVITQNVGNNENNKCSSPNTDNNSKNDEIIDDSIISSLLINSNDEEDKISLIEDLANRLFLRREDINKLNQIMATSSTDSESGIELQSTRMENSADHVPSPPASIPQINSADVIKQTNPATIIAQTNHVVPEAYFDPSCKVRDPRIQRMIQRLEDKLMLDRKYLSALPLKVLETLTTYLTKNERTIPQPTQQQARSPTEPKQIEAKSYPEHKRLKAREAALRNKQNVDSHKTSIIEKYNEIKNKTKAATPTVTANNIKSSSLDMPNETLMSSQQQTTRKSIIQEQSEDSSKESQADTCQISPDSGKSNEIRTNRVLKGLECTINGFNSMQDYISPLDGKRMSSVKARSTIAEQLKQTDKRNELNSDDRSSSESSKSSENPLKRPRSTSLSESDEELCAKRNNRYLEDTDYTVERALSHKALKKLNTQKQKSVCVNYTSNMLSFLKPCYVQIERMPNEMYYLSKLRQTLGEDENMIELDIARIEEEPAESIATHSHIDFSVANIDSTMTEDTTKFCVLCKSKPRNLTQHYVRVHGSESYVSRLSEHHLNYLSENIPYAVPWRARGNLLHYKVECGFGPCHEDIRKPFDKLFDHYAKHTGEYAYQCSQCGVLFVDRNDLSRHRSKSKECKHKRSITLYQYPKNLKTIYLYYCKLCNFAQLNLANTYKHLRDHHLKRGDDPAYIDKIILCTIDFEKSNSMQSELNVLNVCVNNEPIADDDAPLETYDDNENIIEENQDIIKCETNSANTSLSQQLFANDDTDLQSNIAHFVQIPHSENMQYLDQHKPLHLKEEFIFSNKPHSTYRIYENLQFGLFKCMAVDCDFATDIDDEMLKHLNDHFHSLHPPHGCLNCAYCQLDCDPIISTKQLVEHVRKTHGSSRYQCSVCCYRSCSAENVALHFQTNHANSLISSIYECNGTTSEESVRLQYMIRSMVQNVNRLNCSLCPAAYFAVSSLEEHYNLVHQGSYIVKPQFKSFACIYCNDAKFNKIKMQQHNALYHPDELNFACLRRYRTENTTDDTIKNMCLINITAIDMQIDVKLAADVTKENEKCDSTLQVPMKDEKPSTEELYMRQREIVKASLKKLTAGTGIPPDQLYICPESNCCAMLSNIDAWIKHLHKDHNDLGYITYPCPHCKIDPFTNTMELSQHFLAHLRHTFVCFHCGETFAEEKCMREHFSLKHQDLEDQLRLEHVQFNRKYAYLIGMATEPYEDHFSMLCDIQEMLLRRIEELKELVDNELHSKWNIPLQDGYLDDMFILDPDILTTAVQCLAPACHYKSHSVKNLKNHMTAHNIVDRAITCIECRLKFAGEKNFDCFLRHLQNKHILTTIHVCCLCNYKCATRKTLFKHILAEHNKRDTFELLLTRDTKSKAIGLGVWFAIGCKTFTSTKNCFCCDKTDVEALVMHLREEHQISMAYHCAYCNEKLTNLQVSNEHFKTAHENMQLKLFAVLQSKNLVSVKAVNPIAVSVASQIQKTIVKGFDSDILAIYEGDDLVIAEEIKKANEERAQSKGKISFVNVAKLMPDIQNQTKRSFAQQIPPPTSLNNVPNNNNPAHHVAKDATFPHSFILGNGTAETLPTRQPLYTTMSTPQHYTQRVNTSRTTGPTPNSGNHTNNGSVIFSVVPAVPQENITLLSSFDQALKLMQRYPQLKVGFKAGNNVHIIRKTAVSQQIPTNTLPIPNQHLQQPNNNFNYNLLNRSQPSTTQNRYPQ